MAQRKQFLLRIDPRLWAELEAWAAEELRSVNGQIEYILREAVRRRKGFREDSPGDWREKGTDDERSTTGETGGEPA